MPIRLLKFWICGFACLLLGNAAAAHDWYAAPNGTPLGNGSIASPWDLSTAIGTLTCAPPSAVQPGDTIWLRAGTYVAPNSNGFKSCLNGTASAPIIVRNYNGERATIDGYHTQNTIYMAGSYTWFWGIEFMDHNTLRSSPLSGSNNQPNSLGPSIYSPNIKFINCIVHDTAQGFSGYALAPNLEVYGSLSYYNGYSAPDRNHGHGVYMQNTTGTKLIADNFVGDNADEGIQVYGNAGALIGITLQGNTAYNTWSWPSPHYQANIIMGGGGTIYGNSILQNMSFFTLSQQYGSVDIGQYTGSYDIDVEKNVFVGGINTVAIEGINSPFTFTGNTMVNLPSGTNSTVQEQIIFGQYSGQSTSGYSWDNNIYYGTNLFYSGTYDGQSLSNGSSVPFSIWHSGAIDTHSSFTPTLPTGKWIYVRPNKYEAKRANITVYNWDAYDKNGNVILGKSPTVQVDLSSILASGDHFVIQDAQNFYGPPVVSGTYAGGTVTIPMEGLTKAAPYGFAAPAHTAPAFGTFIVMVPGAGNATGGSGSSGPTTSQPLAITTSSLAAGQAGTAYSATIAATGGTAPYKWSSTGLPSGLNLSAAGAISGTPAASGTFNVAITVSDSAATQATAGKTISLGIAPALAPTSPPTVPGVAGVTISPTPVSIAVGATQQFAASVTCVSAGCQQGVTWTASAGTISSAGLFTAPQAAGSATLQATSAQDSTKSASFTLAVTSPPPASSLVSISVSPSNAAVQPGTAQQFTATGYFSNGNTQDLTNSVSWSSSSTSVATLNSNGLASVQGPGSAIISATISGNATIIGQAAVNSGTPSSTLPSGLVLHWTFDSTSISGNTVTDSSPSKQTGTIYGSPVSVAGALGQALKFNGANSYVSTLTGAPFTSSITLAAWINTTNKSRAEAIIARYDAAGSGTGYIFRTDAAGHLEVIFGGANGGSINAPALDTAVINDGQWHHVLAVIMVGQGVQFYVDGKPTAYVPQSFWAADASVYFYVGLNSFTYFGNFFTGSIDDVQAYNRALSPSEANTVYLLSGGH